MKSRPDPGRFFYEFLTFQQRVTVAHPAYRFDVPDFMRKQDARFGVADTKAVPFQDMIIGLRVQISKSAAEFPCHRP